MLKKTKFLEYKNLSKCCRPKQKIKKKNKYNRKKLKGGYFQ